MRVWLTLGGQRSTSWPLAVYSQTRRVHNLTVADIHTYYVLARATPVLVHNSNCWRTYDAADIARGHADRKHASEFPGMSASDLEEHVKGVIRNPLRAKDLNNNRKAYLGQDGETIVIHDPMHGDGGTVFWRGADTVDEYWNNELN